MIIPIGELFHTVYTVASSLGDLDHCVQCE